MARPARPEPKVFLSDEARRPRRSSGTARPTSPTRPTELVLGEKSTSYIEDPRGAARAAAMLGDPHVVVLLRDPVARAVSNWRFSTDNGLEDRPLEVALAREPGRRGRLGPGARRRCRRSPTSSAAGTSTTSTPWLEAFRDAVHVQFLAELVADDAAARRALRRLGVDPAFRPPARDRAGQRERETGPRARRRAASSAGGVLRGERPRAERRCSGGTCPGGRRPEESASRWPRRAAATEPPHPVQRPRSRVASSSTCRSRSGAGTRRPAARSPPAPAALLAEATGAEEVLLTTSCTSALELSAMLLDLGPGDTVDRAVVHVHHHRPGLRPPGRPAAVLRHRAATRSASTPRTSPSCSTTRSGRSSSSTTPASRATSRASARCSPTGRTSR